MRMHTIAMLVLLSIGLLESCGSYSASTTVDAQSHNDKADNANESANIMGSDGDSDNPIPKELWTIPNEYLREADQQGTLVELRYDTYESRTYAQKSKPITKRAIVYLPYEYSDEKEYNVLYLMHGGWSNETTTLGTPEQPSTFKQVVDHAIRNGEFDPLIIVCPTYNNESPEDSADYTLAFYTLTANYHQELVNDLIPAVEGTYSTYAKGTSAEDIRASRDHRAFGGFSMGSVATWHTFINCLDAFRYFLPMSGAMDYDGDVIDAAVTASDFSPDDYFIYAITGSNDFAYGQFARQIEAMIAQPSGNFKLSDDQRSGNIAYRVKEGYTHDGRAAMEYTYNELRWFWN